VTHLQVGEVLHGFDQGLRAFFVHELSSCATIKGHLGFCLHSNRIDVEKERSELFVGTVSRVRRGGWPCPKRSVIDAAHQSGFVTGFQGFPQANDCILLFGVHTATSMIPFHFASHASASASDTIRSRAPLPVLA
jgi:hypothetical protein